MPTLKARILGSWLGDRFMQHAQVERVDDFGPNFRLLRLAAPSVKDTPPEAGDKVQVFVPDVGSRTFTPFDVDTDAGAFSLLGFMHAGERTPAADWLRDKSAGSKVRYVPGRSLALASFAAPVALFGDETSFAVGHSLLALRADSAVRFEVASVDAAAPAATALALPAGSLVAAKDGNSHLGDIAKALAAAAGSGGTIVLTGRARSIQALRALLRGHRTATKPYWADGKRGLD